MWQSLDKQLAAAESSANRGLMFVDRAVECVLAASAGPDSQDARRCANFMVGCVEPLAHGAFRYPRDSRATNLAVVTAAVRGFAVVSEDAELARFVWSLGTVPVVVRAVAPAESDTAATAAATNCVNTGSVAATSTEENTMAGGIIGNTFGGTETTLENVSNVGQVTATSNERVYVGGIAKTEQCHR